ncbi:MAG: protein kinase domain-containing protein [Phycisphaerae bacterium]
MDETIESIRAAVTQGEGVPTLDLDAQGRSTAAQSVPQGIPKIDGYRIDGVLGKGGMGIVYRAVQIKLNRTVALKVLPAVIGAASDGMVSRFRREALSAARLHHTNIIPVYDYGEVEDGYYYAMELVDGKPMDEIVRDFSGQAHAGLTNHRLGEFLTDLLPNESGEMDASDPEMGPLSKSQSPMGLQMGSKSRVYYRQVAYWIADVAEALDYSHGHGIIHRDIKPGNLILSRDGRMMVADFGLAKDMDEPSVTQTGAVVGTARYLSPEQAQGGKVPLDHRTDVYSLGATMYELLCFQPAFPENDQRKLLTQVVNVDPRRPKTILPLVPLELETICMKAMEKAADARYATAKDLAEDLRRYLNDIPIAARRPSLPRRVFKFVKRNRVVLTVATALTIAVVALGNDLYQRQQKRVALAHAYAEAGQNLVIYGEYEEAEKEFQRALAISPGSIITRANMIYMYIRQSMTSSPEEASVLLGKGAELCEWVLEREPENISVLNYYGVCLKRLGKFEEAIEQFLKVEHEQFYAALSNLGTCYAVVGDDENAASYLRKAATCEDAKKENVWAADAWRNLAAFELHRGNKKSLEYVEQSLKKSTDPMSFIVRAKIRMDLESVRDLKRAMDDTVAADANSENIEKKQIRALVKRVRGLAHLRNGDLEGAARYAEEAQQLEDEPTINWLVQSVAHARLGRLELAESALARAVESWPRKLRRRGDFYVTAGGGWIWYDTGQELFELYEQAKDAISENS